MPPYFLLGAPGPEFREYPAPSPCQGLAPAVGHLYGSVVLVLGWARGAQTPFLQGELCCVRTCMCVFWGGTGTTKSLLVRAGDYSPPTSRSVLWTWQRGPSFSWCDVPSSSSPASSYPLATEHPDLTSSVSVPTQTTPQGETVKLGPNLSHHGGSSPPRLDVVEHILTPGIIVVLLLLAVAAGILAMLSRKRKKALSGAAVEMDRTRSASHTGADSLNYADINHHRGTAESQLYSNAEAFRCLANTATEYMEVKPGKRLEEEKEAMYASVRKSPPEQQEIYANVPSAPRPKEEPYSTVRRV
ncbi:uncharacterized protein LOC142090997 isoform X1 [Calonectris borealis]|uniref:uncharacterized protein LOC142090997 isoform X1 n=1 Tax=Calonectris borealis TaxID=1323832 RepID=UPI003F4BB88D